MSSYNKWFYNTSIVEPDPGLVPEKSSDTICWIACIPIWQLLTELGVILGPFLYLRF